jgi:hypothetical protein
VARGFAGDKRPTREEQGKEPVTVTADGLKSDNARGEKLNPKERLALNSPGDMSSAVAMETGVPR